MLGDPTIPDVHDWLRSLRRSDSEAGPFGESGDRHVAQAAAEKKRGEKSLDDREGKRLGLAQRQVVDLNDAKISYVVRNAAGPALVLIPGSFDGAESWLARRLGHCSARHARRRKRIRLNCEFRSGNGFMECFTKSRRPTGWL